MGISSVYAQTCPPNIDFENGNFDGWRFYTGNVSNQGGVNVFTLTENDAPVYSRHTLIAANQAETDPYGGFPTISPNGSGYSIRLGNDMGGGEGEAISYEFTIPQNRDKYSLVYYYAVVFQDPDHQIYEQPRMEIEIANLSNNSLIECASFTFIPFGTGLPGFFESDNPMSTTPVWCKNWTPVTINLDGNAGKTIRLTFRTGDCTFRRHFGYAYIDVDTDCSGEFVGASFCPQDPEITVSAPFGFESYAWYNEDKSRLLGNGQTLTISPAPASGTKVNVALTPYPGFGCPQTLTARLVDNLVASANAGKDTVSCNLQAVRIGSGPKPGLDYTWSPALGLSNPKAANPFAAPTVTTEYELTVRSPGGGCSNTDKVKVIASNLGGSMEILGRPQYCIGSLDSAVLIVSEAETIRWFKNNQLITGENRNRYKVLETGSYNAFLQDLYGCSASTPIQAINISSIPSADFNASNLAQCLIGNSFNFLNGSTNAVGTMQYRWDFGGSGTSTARSPNFSFPVAGQFQVKLVVNSNTFCADSLSVPVTVYQNPVPKFEGKAICIGFPYVPDNLTDENIGSPINYSWDFGNGQSSNQRAPNPQIYNTRGQFKVTLRVSSEQCPTPVQSFTQTLQVEIPMDGIIYPGIFTLRDRPIILEARKIGVSALWDPAFQLNDPRSYAPAFKGSSDQEYTITLTTEGGCVTIDKLLVEIVEKADIQVPTAFTPNGDGLNDYLRPALMGVSDIKYFRIFNRWGEVIYQSSTVKPGWDGSYKGVLQPPQSYVWMVEGIGPDGVTIQKKGTTVLIR